ncbi:hypothetical protein D3C79_1013190 [compost metagenome]
MVDGLAAFRVAVHDHAETFLAALFDSQALGGEQDVASQGLVFFGQVIEGANVLFRDDQKMYRCRGCNVLEGQDLVVFIDDICRDFPVDDFEE